VKNASSSSSSYFSSIGRRRRRGGRRRRRRRARHGSCESRFLSFPCVESARACVFVLLCFPLFFSKELFHTLKTIERSSCKKSVETSFRRTKKKRGIFWIKKIHIIVTLTAARALATTLKERKPTRSDVSRRRERDERERRENKEKRRRSNHHQHHPRVTKTKKKRQRRCIYCN